MKACGEKKNQHVTFSETMIKLNWQHNYNADLWAVCFGGIVFVWLFDCLFI